MGKDTPPPTHQLQSTCVWEGSRVPNLQTEFNYLDSFKSYGIFSDSVVPVVPTLSPSSPHHPVGPHVIPIIPTSSPHHRHSPQKVPMWSPWLWSPWSPPHVVPMVPVVPTLSPSSPCCPRHPHIIPIAPRRYPCGPHGCGLHPMLSLSSPHHPHCPHIIPIITTLSPHHLEGCHIISNPPDSHCIHPHPLGGPKSVKMQ